MRTIRIAPNKWIVLLILFFAFTSENKGQTTSKKVFDYVNPVSLYRLGEDLVELSILNSRKNQIGIRICTKLQLPLGMLKATADPFFIAEKLKNSFGYTPEKVLFIFSKDCIDDSVESKTEIWFIPDNASFPSNHRYFDSNQISLTPMSKKPFIMGMKDYKDARNTLLKNLKKEETSVGVILGFFLEKPNSFLKKRLIRLNMFFKKNNVKKTRLVTLIKPWNDESFPKEKEPKYPIVYIMHVPSEVIDGNW